MVDILNIILAIGTTILFGIFCAFFVVLNLFYKDKLWEEYYETSYQSNDK